MGYVVSRRLRFAIILTNNWKSHSTTRLQGRMTILTLEYVFCKRNYFWVRDF
jgi:hypothetical protein